ncbi:hypothetical protein RB597_007715 [Gaeumannomyces tritici]
MVSSWIPRRFRPRNLGYLSLALLSVENDSDDEYDEKDCGREGSFHDNDDDDDDRASVTDTLVGGSSPTESGLLAENFDEKAVYRTRKPPRRALAWALAALAKLSILLPSFVVPGNKPAGKLHPSAWLDGLRGWAAFLVVWHHASLLFFSWNVHDAYRSSEDPNDPQHNYAIQMPWVRLLIAGAPQVKIFFVISGYALSYKPLKLAHAARYGEWASAMSSSVFRRWPRLFLPAVIILFMGTIVGYNRYFGDGDDKWNDGAAITKRPPPIKDELAEQLWDLWGNILQATNPFSNDERRSATPYDWNLWTLGMEFDCSMVLFLCMAAFCRIRTLPRLVLTVCTAAFCLWWKHWPPFLFISGMFLCDLRFTLEGAAARAPPATLLPTTPTVLVSPLRQQNTSLMRARRVAFVVYHHSKRLVLAVPSYLPESVQAAGAAVAGNPHATRLSCASSTAYERVSSSGVPARLRSRARGARNLLLSASLWRGLLSLFAVVVAVFFLSFPGAERGGNSAPYYGWLIRDWTPKHYEDDNESHWWISLGAVLLIFVLDRNTWMQRAFTTRFAQYLGRISYALYLVHGPMLWSIGWHLGRWATAYTGRETERQYCLGVALALGLLWPMLIWASDVACRLIDEKSVVFAKWAYDSLAKKED